MATTISYDRPQFTTQSQYRPDYRPGYATGDRTTYYNQQQGQGQSQSTSKTLAIVALLPVGGILLGLAGLTLVGTLIGLAVATPLFVIFSPILVPAVLTIGLAVAGFLTSGTFGLTGLSSLSYLFNLVRQTAGSVPEALQDVGEYAGQKTKEFGQKIQETAHDAGEYAGQKTKEFGQRVQNTGHEIGEQGHGQGQGAHGGLQAGVNVQVGGGKEGRKGGGGGDRDRS